MSGKIVVIDYKAGNLRSIANILSAIGADYKISSSATDIKNAEKLIFPGQGHFKQAMGNLEKYNLCETVLQSIEAGKQFLGICLGLQILFETSEEAPNYHGLGVFHGTVKKFTHGKIPQIGWNKIQTTVNNSFLSDDYFYFVNSYYVEPQDDKIVSSYTDYGINFCSSVQKDNITAVQFHPEKSSDAGMKFFKLW